MTQPSNNGARRLPVDALRLELRRGTLVLAVLAALRTAMNGVAVRAALASAGLSIEEGALYPMLRRLEEQGLLQSEWRVEGIRNKRIYRISKRGQEDYATLLAVWLEQNRGLRKLVGRDLP